jgi:hypothetical protein
MARRQALFHLRPKLCLGPLLTKSPHQHLPSSPPRGNPSRDLSLSSLPPLVSSTGCFSPKGTLGSRFFREEEERLISAFLRFDSIATRVWYKLVLVRLQDGGKVCRTKVYLFFYSIVVFFTYKERKTTTEHGSAPGFFDVRRERHSIPVILTYENGFFKYHGFLTITSSSRIISRDDFST